MERMAPELGYSLAIVGASPQGKLFAIRWYDRILGPAMTLDEGETVLRWLLEADCDLVNAQR